MNTAKENLTPDELLSRILVSGSNASASLSSQLYTLVTELTDRPPIPPSSEKGGSSEKIDEYVVKPMSFVELIMPMKSGVEEFEYLKKLEVLKVALPNIPEKEREELARKEVMAQHK